MSAVRKLAETRVVGSCTAINQAALRAMLRSRIITVITDGNSSCPWFQAADGSPYTMPVSSGDQLFFLLTPSADEQNSPGEKTISRGALIQQIFPSADVAPLTEAMTPSF